MELLKDERAMVFKSLPENYYAELQGDKCNTIREIPNDELEKYDLVYDENLKRFVVLGDGVVEEIIILNSVEDTGFGRSLTDVRPFNFGFMGHMQLWVFSWHPEIRNGYDDTLYIRGE